MEHSRTKNTILIFLTSGLRQILSILLVFVSRTVFIYVLGAEYLGLNGLFSNILSLLSLSELGIGSTIAFYLYKPLVEKNQERIKTLMSFYKTCYKIVGLTIVLLGTCIMPFLHKLVNLDQGLPENLYLIYFIYLLNTASTYLCFAYKQTLVVANQEQYKIEKVNIIFTFINCLVDIILLVIFRKYVIYLIGKLLLVLGKNIVISFKIDKEYPFLKEKDIKALPREEKRKFIKDIQAVALFKVGSVLFNATDNIIISVMLGTVIVGYYSNYYMIIFEVTVIINIIINSLIAGIGNVIAKETKEKQYMVFKELDFIVYLITCVFTCCLFQLLNPFIELWIGKVDGSYILSQSVVAVLCISFYFDSTTQVLNSFRVGSGNFETGKSLQIIAGFVNIILSIIFAKYCGLFGIFLATVISKGCITVVPFCIRIGQNVFGKGKTEILRTYIYRAVIMSGICMFVWILCQKIQLNSFGGIVIKLLITVSVSLIMLILIYKKTEEIVFVRERIKGIVEKLNNK